MVINLGRLIREARRRLRSVEVAAPLNRINALVLLAVAGVRRSGAKTVVPEH